VAVHCETSTGVLNDWGALKRLSAARGEALHGLHFIDRDGAGGFWRRFTCVRHFGKGLRGYPGLAWCFHDSAVGAGAGSVAAVLDLGFYVEKGGVRSRSVRICFTR